MLVIILHAEILAMCVCLARFAKHIPVIRLTYASRCIQMTAHTKKKKKQNKTGAFLGLSSPARSYSGYMLDRINISASWSMLSLRMV